MGRGSEQCHGSRDPRIAVFDPCCLETAARYLSGHYAADLLFMYGPTFLESVSHLQKPAMDVDTDLQRSWPSSAPASPSRAFLLAFLSLTTRHHSFADGPEPLSHSNYGDQRLPYSDTYATLAEGQLRRTRPADPSVGLDAVQMRLLLAYHGKQYM